MRSTRNRSLVSLVCAVTLTSLVACQGQGGMSGNAMSENAASVDKAAEAQKIRQLDQQWVQAVGRKDVDASAGFYAADGRMMPAGSPAAVGADAIRQAWAGLLQLPDLSLSFAPDTIAISDAGDMAYDIGTYDLKYTGEDGPVGDQGKYVVVWEKKAGEWKVMADIFNSDGSGM